MKITKATPRLKKRQNIQKKLNNQQESVYCTTTTPVLLDEANIMVLSMNNKTYVLC
jgi:hypothetical protein